MSNTINDSTMIRELKCDKCGEVYHVWHESDSEYLENNPTGSSVYEHEQYLRHLHSECPHGDDIIEEIKCPDCGEVLHVWREADREYLEKNPTGKGVFEFELIEKHTGACDHQWKEWRQDLKETYPEIDFPQDIKPLVALKRVLDTLGEEKAECFPIPPDRSHWLKTLSETEAAKEMIKIVKTWRD